MKSIVCVLGVVVLAIACTCSATYHLKQKTFDKCDMSALVYFYTNDPNHYNKTDIISHGSYLFLTDYYCTSTDVCNVTSITLFRPDLSLFDDDALRYIWTPIYCGESCNRKDVLIRDEPNPHKSFEEWFENREKTVFHDRKCFKFFNKTDIVVFGDDTTGEIFGMKIDNFEYVYTFSTTMVYQPTDFVFDKDKQSACGGFEEHVFDPPDEMAWKGGCSGYPN